MRVCALVVLALLGFIAPVAASDMTGIYVMTFHGGLDYFNLTDQGGYVSGYLQIVSVDLSNSDGVNRRNIPVSGSVRGSRIVFNVNGNQWTADIGWNGFTANVPQQSGQIAQVWFHRSSIDEVNRMVASITQSGNAAKSSANVQAQAARNYANAQAELADSQQRLSNDQNYYRPKILQSIIAAKKRLAAAQAKEQQAEAEVERRKQIAAQAHQTADDAMARATTHDEELDAHNLDLDAHNKDLDRHNAELDVHNAQLDVDWATKDLLNDKNDLVKVDARIAQLRGIIAADKRFLHIQ